MTENVHKLVIEVDVTHAMEDNKRTLSMTTYKQ